MSSWAKIRMSKLRCVLMLLWALVMLSGCGQGLPVAPASGVVLLDGAPLANVSIMTQPIATNSPNPGPGSFGRTDAEGRFELELVKPAVRGAIIGEHRVMITPVGAVPPSRKPDDIKPLSRQMANQLQRRLVANSSAEGGNKGTPCGVIQMNEREQVVADKVVRRE